MATMIERRVVRMESRNQRVRPGPWNVVRTPLGTCWEPGPALTIGVPVPDAVGEIDQDDEFVKVNRVEFDWDNRDPFYRDPSSGQPLMGGAANGNLIASFS